MQRLKQHNSGALLPLHEDEVLSASTTQTLDDGSWCHVRMRIARNGEAERSVHHYDGADHSAFHHESLVVSELVLAEIRTLTRAAFLERASVPEEEDDSQALYRTIVFRDEDARPAGLAVEYENDVAIGPAAAFESAWRRLAGQFSRTGIDARPMPGLHW